MGIEWNRIMKDLQSDYRVTFRLMMKEAKHKYGNDIVNKVYENGETTLHTAVIKGEETSVEILLSLGADMFVKSQNGKQLLKWQRDFHMTIPKNFSKFIKFSKNNHIEVTHLKLWAMIILNSTNQKRQ